MNRFTGLVVVFAFLVSASLAWGAIPQTINYQGYLKKADGTLVTVTTRVVFSIYKEQSGGEPLWTETHNLDPDATGRYTVVLGSKQPDGLPADLLASGESRWVGVRMEWDAEQPRVLLVSVPYALKAGDAETIGGKPLSAFLLAGSTSGTGTDGLTYLNPNAPAPTGGAQTSSEALPQASSGTIGYIGKFTSSTNLGNSAIYQSTTANRIGIGTTSPLAALHLVSPSGPAGYLDVYSGASTTALGSTPLAQRGARGTKAAPSAVKTNDYLGGISAAGYGTAFSGARGGIALRAGENWTGTKQGTYIQFQTTPTGSSTLTERMRIAANGNVGIGTSIPANKLSVAGTIQSTSGGFKFPDNTVQSTAGLTGTVPISKGGTGITTAPTAARQFLRSTGAGAWGVGALQSGDIPSLSASYVNLTGAQTITGVKTFNPAGAVPPFAVGNSNMVTNLNAEMVGGKKLTDLDLRYGQHPVAQLPRANTITTLDSAGDVGWYTSITIGSDGLPVISYLDDTNGDLKVAHCSNAACTTSTITTLDSAGYVGRYTSITIGSDGLPVISYYDYTNGDLKVAHCSNAACTTSTITTPDSDGNVGYDTSITIGSDGLPVISYLDATNYDLKVAHCSNAACTTATTTTPDSAGYVGWNNSITIGSDGLPVISYYDYTNGDLKVAHCSNAACTTSTITTPDSTGNVGWYTSITIGSDGLPVISYYDYTNSDLKVAHCSNAACTTATITTPDSAGDVGWQPSITIGSDGLPVISSLDLTNVDLKVAHCSNAACTTATISNLDSAGDVGFYSSITIGSDGLPVISYNDDTNDDLKVVKCANQFCVNNFTRR